MNILITNDDGFQAPGLRALHRAMSSLGRVSVVAPAVEKSMCSHGIQLRHPIRVDEIRHPEMGRIYAVDAWPSDCVRLALACLLDQRPDWVISGINAGANVGVDVYYSGTVAGAREAAIHGIPAISFSHFFGRETAIDWPRATRLAAHLFEKLSALPSPRPAIWNVTFPQAPLRSDDQSAFLQNATLQSALQQNATPASETTSIPEIVFCPMSTDPFPLIYRQESIPQPALFPDAPARRHFRYTGEYTARPRKRGTDVDALFSGKIAVTAMELDLTAASMG